MTGINIPDMINIVKRHGLVPVPLDLDPDTMAPVSVEAMTALITPKVISETKPVDQSSSFCLSFWNFI